ncbi:MAG TPA: heparinase II/III family protein [Alphaproteobacteria bacterium]|nr:heparinase II/III family protein [Alphaproteobacteria bacterium]
MIGLGEAPIGRALRALGLAGAADRDTPTELSVVPPNPWPGDATRGRAMVTGVFAVSGDTVIAEGSIWDADAGTSWACEMHAFEWLRDLRAMGGDSARRHARLLTTEWLDRFQRRGDIAWRTDVMGARIANWVGFHDFFCASAEDSFRSRLFASLGRQARALARALPGELSGAPLLIAIKGLLASGACVTGSEGRFAQAERLLLRELARQILPDGCHAERCPMVHTAVLGALVDIRAIYRAARIEMPEEIQHAIDRMAPALRFFRHADGGLALFNGSQEGEALLLDTILTQADARGRPMKRAPQGGFDRVSLGRTVILIDSGGPAPAGLDRHAHAGIGSFEMSVGRERFIVNCGARPGAGPWRSALAATAAHSTVTVADTNQMVLVDGGGVARRPKTVESHREDSPEGVLLEIFHDGYANLGLTHRRRLYLAAGGEDFRGEDSILGDAVHPFAIRFHLHPDVHASLTQNGRTALLRLGDGSGWRFRSDGETIMLEDSVYFGAGDTPRRTNALVIAGHAGGGETTIRWAFHREKRHSPSHQE